MNEAIPVAPPIQPFHSGIPEIAPESAVCLRCGYLVRGLATSGNCPECGTPIARSLMGNLLEYSAPEYVENLHRGLSLILLATIGQIVVGLLAIGGAIWALSSAASGTTPAMNVDMWLKALTLPFSVLMLIGWWMFSMPDPAVVGRETGQTPRQLIRITVIITAAAALLDVALQATFANSPLLQMAFVATLLASVAGIVQFFASILYIRWLAPRLPDQQLVQQSSRYLWLLPAIYIVGLCIIIGPLIALVMYLLMLNQVRLRLGAVRDRQAAQTRSPLLA